MSMQNTSEHRIFKMDTFNRGRDGRVCFSLKCRQEKEAGKNWFPIEHMAMTSQGISSYRLTGEENQLAIQLVRLINN